MGTKVDLPVEILRPQDVLHAFPVIKQLRPQLSEGAFLDLVARAHEQDRYQLAILREQGTVVAAMGFRILYDLVHGKHVYVDDLVVDESRRSAGLGATLLRYADEVAKKESCTGLRLSTGVGNESAKKFYEREGWTLKSVTYKKKLGEE